MKARLALVAILVLVGCAASAGCGEPQTQSVAKPTGTSTSTSDQGCWMSASPVPWHIYFEGQLYRQAGVAASVPYAGTQTVVPTGLRAIGRAHAAVRLGGGPLMPDPNGRGFTVYALGKSRLAIACPIGMYNYGGSMITYFRYVAFR